LRKEVLQYLGCLGCQSELVVEERGKYRGDIKSGTLVCRNCGLEYPVIAGRPVLLWENAVNEWTSPVSEAMGINDYRTIDQSIKELFSMGEEEAIKLVQERVDSNMEVSGPLKTIPRSVVGKMKYRESGKWMEAGNRRERLLRFPWTTGDKEDSFNIFMERIASTEPDSILDIASGGGFAVSHQAFINTKVKQILAVERDLKCLGNIQFRFKHIGSETRSEAVGGDVRNMPVGTEAIGTAMMLAALPEISGITIVIREALRVLKEGGAFVLLVTEDPIAPELKAGAELGEFAAAADLYAGYEKFESDAEQQGFSVESSRRFEGKQGMRRRLISLKK
jgi:ubiquinone/menaquinone biosynthesis C-methylase UbiE/uncharacterized protein YbaR (Trm112 family)